MINQNNIIWHCLACNDSCWAHYQVLGKSRLQQSIPSIWAMLCLHTIERSSIDIYCAKWNPSPSLLLRHPIPHPFLRSRKTRNTNCIKFSGFHPDTSSHYTFASCVWNINNHNYATNWCHYGFSVVCATGDWWWWCRCCCCWRGCERGLLVRTSRR